MNNCQFLEETHRYINDTYHEFEKYQDLAFEILCEFDRVCKCNRIQYFLAYGTLLGAIRDGGQIPWDYDIDLMVKVHDRDRLIEVLRKQLSPDFYYSYLDNTNKYPAYCLRISKKGHHFNAIHVDVFFLLGCPGEEKKRLRFLKKRKMYCKRRIAKNSYYWFSKKNGRLEKVLYYYSLVRGCLISKKRLDREEKSIINAFPLSASEYCCSLAQEITAFKTEWFNTSEDIKIRDRLFPAPVGYKDILDSLFGSYHEYMPISERFDEFYRSIHIIKDRDHEVDTV